MTTYTVNAPNIREFAFFFSEDFKVAEQHVDGTRVRVYSNRGMEREAVEIAAQALRYYNKMYGKYDYPEYSVVLSAVSGGMEHPNIVTSGSVPVSMEELKADMEELGMNYSTFENDIAHETAHQWWFGIVGNDQQRYSWLDESLTTYSTYMFLRDKYGEDVYNDEYEQVLETCRSLLTDGSLNSLSMDRDVLEFTWDEFLALMYTMPIAMYNTLREEVGNEMFFTSLCAYFDANKYGIAFPDDLVKAFAETTNRPWAEWFDAWTHGTEKL